MSTKRILIFGASSFIGTYLIDTLLDHSYDVIASDINDAGCEYYSNKNIPYVHVDITKTNDFEKLEKIPYDAVIHLAACQPANVSENSYNPKQYIDVNVLGTLNILEFSRKCKVKKIIYTSSHRNTEGLWSKNKAISEDEGRAIKYSGEYAIFSISESCAQDCVLHYQAQYNLNGIIFRLPPVYGYGPHTEIFKNGKPIKTGFQLFIEKAIACQPLEIWGDPNAGRDIIYIKDVVQAFLKGIEKSNVSGIYNITSGKYLTLGEQARITAEVFWGSVSSPEFIEFPERPNGIDPFLYDNTKAKNELDWSPVYTFKDMLLDYKKEMNSKKYYYLINKRNNMFKSEAI